MMMMSGIAGDRCDGGGGHGHDGETMQERRDDRTRWRMHTMKEEIMSDDGGEDDGDVNDGRVFDGDMIDECDGDHDDGADGNDDNHGEMSRCLFAPRCSSSSRDQYILMYTKNKNI